MIKKETFNLVGAGIVSVIVWGIFSAIITGGALLANHTITDAYGDPAGIPMSEALPFFLFMFAGVPLLLAVGIPVLATIVIIAGIGKTLKK